MDVSENSGTPKSSILIGFSIINHPFRGTPIFGNTHIMVMFGRFFLLGRNMSDLAHRKYSHKVWKKSGVCNMPYTFCSFFMEKTTGTYVFLQFETHHDRILLVYCWWFRNPAPVDIVNILFGWRVLYESQVVGLGISSIDRRWWFQRFNYMFISPIWMGRWSNLERTLPVFIRHIDVCVDPDCLTYYLSN